MARDVRTVRFVPVHLDQLAEVEAAEGGTIVGSLAPTMKVQLAQFNSWTHFSPEGRVIACGGTIQQWSWRHLAWMYLTQESGAYMISLVRAARRVLAKAPGRIEATVVTHFCPGHRFIRLLGFEIENAPGILHAYGPGGEDHIAYVRFN